MTFKILGAGSWGTALAILLARKGHPVSIVGRNADEIDSMRSLRENVKYLQGYMIPDGVEFFTAEEAHPDADLTVVAVPSTAVRESLKSVQGCPEALLIAAKGLEPMSGKLMSEVAHEVCPGSEIGVLSGPNLAIEIARQIPTAAVCAFPNKSLAQRVVEAFAGNSFRVYSSDDLVGLEIAGALKNVLAIGAGMSDGLNYGDNTKGALLARGLGEMTRLGLEMGAKLDTFMGVAGVGDLIATSASKLSRNYRLGRMVGEGKSVQSALDEIQQVVEGLTTSDGVLGLGRKAGVEMPVFSAIDAVLKGHLRPADAVRTLMERQPQADQLIPAQS